MNKHKLKTILRISKNNQKQYFIEKKRLHISKNKIDKIIKNHHDESLQNYSNIFKTLQLLRQICEFLNMKQQIEIYIKNVLIVKKINISHILNTTKFNIKNHQNRHEMKSR